MKQLVCLTSIFCFPGLQAFAACPPIFLTSPPSFAYEPNATDPTTVSFSVATSTLPTSGGSVSLSVYVPTRIPPPDGSDLLQFSMQVVPTSPVGYSGPFAISSLSGFSVESGQYMRAYSISNPSQPAGSPVSADVTITLAPGLQIGEGSYSIPIYALATHGSQEAECNGANPRYEIAEISQTMVVPSSASLNMAGGGVGGTIDFGTTLASGAQQSVNLNVNATTPFEVTMDSNHDGVLKLGDDPASSSEISYTTTLAGQLISQTSAYSDPTPTGTGGNDSTLEFTVTMGDTTAQRAGLYKDTITLTVQPVT